MKHCVWLICCVLSLSIAASDTIYVENIKAPEYLHYLDSAEAYKIGYSVAKNIADSVRIKRGNNALDAYFLSYYSADGEARSDGFFYDYSSGDSIQIGHVNNMFKGIKSDSTLPWQYIEAQYKRLDAIKIKPAGVTQGAELPNVYVYANPAHTLVYRQVKRYTVIDPSIKFLKKENGKTKVAYILKYYYIKIGSEHERIDSVEKLDPIKQEHLIEE